MTFQNPSSLLQPLSGKYVVVTGGNRGIGKAITQRSFLLGAHVLFSYRQNADQAERLIHDLKKMREQMWASDVLLTEAQKVTEPQIIMAPLDLSSAESVKFFAEKVSHCFPTLNGLVNNAGMNKDGLLMQMKEEIIHQILGSNLGGMINLTRQLLRPLMKSRHASIINISSVVGQMGSAGQTIYSAAKAGIDGFTRSLALEVASRNVRVNSVAPGFIETDMTQALNEDQVKKIMEHIPLARLGQANEVAELVCYLMRDEASYITGQTIGLNGGLYCN